jgi:hypothetical protein
MVSLHGNTRFNALKHSLEWDMSELLLDSELELYVALEQAPCHRHNSRHRALARTSTIKQFQIATLNTFELEESSICDELWDPSMEDPAADISLKDTSLLQSRTAAPFRWDREDTLTPEKFKAALSRPSTGFTTHALPISRRRHRSFERQRAHASWNVFSDPATSDGAGQSVGLIDLDSNSNLDFPVEDFGNNLQPESESIVLEPVFEEWNRPTVEDLAVYFDAEFS